MAKRKKAVKKFLFRHSSNFHHFCPRSRINNGDTGKFEPICRILVAKVKIRKHSDWHQVFLNMFAEQAIAQVKKVFADDNFSPEKVIASVREELDNGFEEIEVTSKDLFAWEEIFGNASTFEEIENIIIEEWTYPGVKANIANGQIVSIEISLKNFYRKNIDTLLRKIFRYCKNIKIASTVVDDHDDIILKIT